MNKNIFFLLIILFVYVPSVLAQSQGHSINQITVDNNLNMNNYNVTNTAYLVYNTGIVAGGVRGIPGTDIQPGAVTASLVSSGAIGSTKLANPLMGPINVSGAINASYFYDYDNNNYFLDPANSGTSLVVAGSVGIGTTGPGGQLDVKGTSRFIVQLTGQLAAVTSLFPVGQSSSYFQVYGTNDTTLTNYERTTLFHDAAGGAGGIYTDAGGTGTGRPIVLKPNGTEVMRLTTTGNVGIGTGSPVKNLDVVGTINATSSVCIAGDCRSVWPVSGAGAVTGTGSTNYVSKFTNSTNIGNSQLYDTGTNVGVGTSNPQNTLNVVGDLNYTGSLSGTVQGSNIASGAIASTKLTNPLMGPVNVSGAVNASSFYDYDNNNYYLDPASGGTSLAVAGSVGIGTNSPQDTLHVTSSSNGDIILGRAANTNQAVLITRTGSTNTWTMGTRANSNEYFYLYDIGAATNRITVENASAGNGANQLYLQNTGNVGIGTNSPQGLLHLSKNSYGGLEIENTGTQGRRWFWFASDSGLGGNKTHMGYDNPGFNGGIGGGNLYTAFGFEAVNPGTQGATVKVMTFTSNGAPRNVLDDGSGNVGIGTISPTQKLDVAGNANVSSGNLVVYSGGATVGKCTPSGNGMMLCGGNVLYVQNPNGNNPFINGTDAGGGQNIGFYPNAGTSPTMFIDTLNGNVAVGKNSAGSKLEVNATNSSVAIGSAFGNPPIAQTGIQFLNYGVKHVAFRYDGLGNLTYESAGNSANPMLWYDSGVANFIVRNGNVGIGTTNPGYKLDINGMVSIRNSGANGLRLYEGSNLDTNAVTLYNSGSGNLVFNNSDVQLITSYKRLMFDNSLRYVQGTRSGADSLTISQNAFAPGIQLGFDAGAGFGPTMTITPVSTTNNPGNVGIGTVSPPRKLTVSGGNISITNDTVARSDIYWDATNNRLVIRVN